ncbi:uncharacterized protein LOC117901051 [Drosophila subobscura]|uniref:uncharacterized protein LOC117901051 n=1 Tax=Drosophila subobscura TaxID=7241 RepID=UPI00155B30A5|nr:uncharacterized protein LOC117901051 [Drosophila subobscura]
MPNKRKVTRSKSRSSSVFRRLKKPKPVCLRSLGDLNGSASALDAAANWATENLKKKENSKENLMQKEKSKSPSVHDFLPDDIEALQSESKKKIRNRVANAMRLLNFIEGGCEDSDSEDPTPVTLSQMHARARSRSAHRRPAAMSQRNNDVCSNCLIRCRSRGHRRNIQKGAKK